MKQGRVIVADRHLNTLGAIRRLLETETESVLMVADETSLWDALEKFKPDLVVVDLSLPLPEGSSAAMAIKTRCPWVKVIILSLDDDKSVVDDVMAAGAEGFVLKRRAGIDLIPALHEVLGGHHYISHDVEVG